MAITYYYPDINLLDNAGTAAGSDYQQTAQTLNEIFRAFGVSAVVNGVQCGPAVNTYRVDLAPGTPVRRLKGLQVDISYRLGVNVRFSEPNGAYVGLEVPNGTPSRVGIREYYGRMGGYNDLTFALGNSATGKVVCDLAKMPHLLIAGATGSGKSVCINSIITSMLLHTYPRAVRMVMIDPKQVELTRYDGIPHLACPVITDCNQAAMTLQSIAYSEMDKRYKHLQQHGCRDIQTYNAQYPDEQFSRLVVVIDELADLMIRSRKMVEDAIVRIAQLGRAAGIHLVVATQRPSREVVTGLIKANLPSRIAFATASAIDSRVILDRNGAEKLLGRGDMLYKPADSFQPIRLQGVYVSDGEVERVVNDLKTRCA